MKNIDLNRRWAVAYRGCEDGKKVIRISHTETNKAIAELDAKQAGKNHFVALTSEVINMYGYRKPSLS